MKRDVLRFAARYGLQERDVRRIQSERVRKSWSEGRSVREWRIREGLRSQGGLKVSILDELGAKRRDEVVKEVASIW